MQAPDTRPKLFKFCQQISDVQTTALLLHIVLPSQLPLRGFGRSGDQILIFLCLVKHFSNVTSRGQNDMNRQPAEHLQTSEM